MRPLRAALGLASASVTLALVSTLGLGLAAAASPSPKPGPCARWSDTLCAAAGADSETCHRASEVAPILPPKACEAALTDIAGTVARAKALRKVCSDLTARLCRDIGEDTETCAVIRKRTPSFPVAQCEEMAANYEAVLSEVQVMERQRTPLSADLVARQSAADAPSFGPKDARVVLVEYSDFQCPYCAMAADGVRKIKAKYGDRVRFVFRQFPLPFHEHAQLAAEASLEAAAQGKFWELHDLLFANQDKLDRAGLTKLAKQAGLDVDKLAHALDEGTHTARVAADLKLGEEAGVNGTPSMMLGPDRIANPTDVEAVSAAIEAALAKSPAKPNTKSEP